MHLARFPRARFAHLPTPLEPLPRLGAALGVDLWVKRDDCTGLAGGGNKTRKLEFLLGEALKQGADTLVTQGAVQSNHVRQTIAAGARFGLKTEVILEERTGSKAGDYMGNGNVLLDKLMGAAIRHVPAGSDMVAELESSAESVRQRGGKPYVIPGGGSNTIGALGYVDCARELVVQADQMDLKIDRLVTATGSAGTHAGLVAGFAALSVDIGCVRLTEKYVTTDPPAPEELVACLSITEAHLDDVAREIPQCGQARTFVGLAGTVATAAAVEIGLAEYDRDRIHHFVLTKEAAEDVYRTLVTESRAERVHNPGLEEARADVIVGGMCILVRVMRYFGIDELVVSESDILDGLAASLLD